MIPRVLLATLVLNEMEWLPKLIQQHINWPGCIGWVFVEAADSVYATSNPDMVSEHGLSVDGTTEYLENAARIHSGFIRHVKFGATSDAKADQGKCAARNVYLRIAEQVGAEFVMVLDADEFYTHEHQHTVNYNFVTHPGNTAFCFPHIHPWKPPIYKDRPLFEHMVIGGFWAIPHVRGWRMFEGMSYDGNHNTPSTREGMQLTRRMLRTDPVRAGRYNLPQCVHMAFSSDIKNRRAKHRYYQARGEGTTDHRGWYVISRDMFETWTPRTVLPRDAKVVQYNGPIPECFK